MKGKVLILTSSILVVFAATNTDVKVSEENNNKISKLLSPSLAYASQYSSLKDVKVNTSILNVRERPTTSSRKISQVLSGQVYSVIDQSNGWYKIKTSTVTGWIHGGYVVVINDSISKTYPTVEVTADRLNVRLEPTTSSYRISQVLKGQKYTPVAQSGKWYKIKTSKVTGWVHGDYVKTVSTSTPAPAPETKYSQMEVTADRLNVRSGTSTSYKIIDQVLKGQKYTPIAKSGTWYKIKTSKVTGWVHGDYLKTVSTSTPAPEVNKKIEITTPILNVRTKPTTSSMRIFQVYEGQKYETLAESNGWYKIDTSKVTGWVHGGYVKVIEEVKEEPVEVLDSIKVSLSKSTIYKNEKATLNVTPVGAENVEYQYQIKDNDKWITVKNYSDTDTYTYTPTASGDYVIRVNARVKGTSQVVSKELSVKVLEVLEDVNLAIDKEKSTHINIPVTISATPIGTENVEYKYMVSYNSGEWEVLKDYSGDTNYTYTPNKRGTYTFKVDARIKDQSPEKVVSSQTSYNILGNLIYQNTNYSKTFQDILLTQLNKNPQTDVYDRTWRTAQVNEVDKYLNPENYLQNSTNSYTYDIVGQLKVTTDTLNVRENATTNSNVVDQVSLGQVYTVLDESKGWYLIQTSNATGWVHGGYVRTSYQAKNNTYSKMEVTADRLNVREGTSTSYSIVDKVLKGEVYTPLEESNGWYKIKTSNTTGWVHGGYLKGVSADTITKGEVQNLSSIEINTEVLNVRNTPSTTGNVIAQVKSKDIYIVLDQQNGWYKIKTNGVVGWVHGDYTQDTNQAPQEMYQFLVLSGNSGLSADQLDNILVGKGILEGQGQAFIEASKQYNINEIYLISHALLETGQGWSKLATGAISVEGQKIYNMYGIGAYDSNPLESGSQYAYKSGWFTPEEAIIGGAKFISEKYV
ncbi:SH3 domain-containing protein, partial [Clostridium sp. D2Q-11]